jgi:hypothetical protein
MNLALIYACNGDGARGFGEGSREGLASLPNAYCLFF